MLQVSDSTKNTVTGCPLVESEVSVTGLRLNQQYCYRLPLIREQGECYNSQTQSDSDNQSKGSVTSLKLNQECHYRLPLFREQGECYKPQTQPIILLQVAP